MQEISRAIVEGSLDAISDKDKERLEREEMERNRDALIAKGGRAVDPYVPNRKQRRAQKSALRRK